MLRLTARLGVPVTPGTAAHLLGSDADDIRVRTDDGRASSELGARAYTVGNDITFAPGEYRPGTSDGDRLLAHEVAHLAQRHDAGRPMVMRDLKAYGRERLEVLPSGGAEMSTSHITSSAEAPGLRTALTALIAAGKVKEVRSSDGAVSWFAAQHHQNVQLSEITDALVAAGYSLADRLARSIYDIHGEYLFAGERLTTIAPFFTHTTDVGTRLSTVHNRSMTEWEIGQARRVFGSAIDYSRVTIADGSLSARAASAGGYARTIGNVVSFPTGASRNMGLMIHELTHVWQYQTTGWTYAPKALWAQVTEGYSYAETGKTTEQSLLDARAAGRRLTDYNNEQQGDILADYFRRLRSGLSVAAWEPFVLDIPGR